MPLSDILGANYPDKHVVLYSDALATVEIERVPWPAFTSVIDGAARSTAECEFDAVGSALTAHAWGIMTAATGGERIYYDWLRNVSGIITPVDLEEGDAPSFEPGNLILYEAPLWGDFLPGDESSLFGSRATLTSLTIPPPVASTLRFVVAPRIT